MSDFKLEKRYGDLRFGELNSFSAFDFERSLTEYIAPETKAKSGFLSSFGQSKFGEIDNPLIKDFKDSFNKYFYKI